MKKIEVAAAIIKKGSKIFATQRGYGEFKGLWEFPGGKLKENEDAKDALVREIKEELNASIEVKDLYLSSSHQYDTFYVTLHFYICTLLDENIELLEHQDAKWITKEEIESLTWLDGERQVIEKLKKDFV